MEEKKRIEKMLERWVVGTLILCTLAFLVGTIHGYLDLPVVYKSNITGKVVKIETKDGVISGPVPERYHLVWVK